MISRSSPPLRTALRGSPPSPSRHRIHPSTSGRTTWTPSIPIKFAPVPRKENNEWHAGQPIKFAKRNEMESIAREHRGVAPPMSRGASTSTVTDQHADVGPARTIREQKGKGVERSQTRKKRPRPLATTSDETITDVFSSSNSPANQINSGLHSDRATLSTAPKSSLSPTSSDDSWSSHRLEPPSSSPSSPSTIELSPSSTAVFDIYRSYNRIASPERPSFDEMQVDKHDLNEIEWRGDCSEVSVGTPHAGGFWGARKTTIGIQVGSPQVPAAKKQRSGAMKENAQVAMSKEAMDDLMQGIDWDDDWAGDMSLEEAPTTAMSPHVTTRRAPIASTSKVQLPSPNRVTTISRSIHPSSLLPLTSISNSIHTRQFSSSSKAPAKPIAKVIEVIEIDSSSEDENEGSRYFDATSASPSSDEVEIISHTRPLPPPEPPKSILPSSSGWFERPANLPERTPATAPAPAKPKRVTKVGKRRVKDNALRTKYPNDFILPKNIEIVYTTSAERVREVLDSLRGPLGFDLEWDMSYKGQKEKKTALVQVCDEKKVLLVHVARMEFFPTALKELIEDANKIKLGVHIGGDGNKLRRDFGFNPLGLLELSKCAKVADSSRWSHHTPALIALATLSGVYLDRYLPKDAEIRCGRWSGELGEEQRKYAASDVYASLQIYQRIEALANPGVDLPSLRTGIPPKPQPAGSYTRPLPPLSTSSSSSSSTTPTPRQLEAYNLWHVDNLSPTDVATKMSESRSIAPLSVMWSVLATLKKGGEFEFSERRLLEDLEGVKGPSKGRMLGEFEDFLEEVKVRAEGKEK